MISQGQSRQEAGGVAGVVKDTVNSYVNSVNLGECGLGIWIAARDGKEGFILDVVYRPRSRYGEASIPLV